MKTKKTVKPVVKAAKAPKAPKTPKAPKKAAAKAVQFTLRADKGREVFVAGSFNDWDPKAKKMRYYAKSGFYAAKIELEPGTYQYKFVADGEWMADPQCADFVGNGCGTLNSVITVK